MYIYRWTYSSSCAGGFGELSVRERSWWRIFGLCAGGLLDKDKMRPGERSIQCNRFFMIGMHSLELGYLYVLWLNYAMVSGLGCCPPYPPKSDGSECGRAKVRATRASIQFQSQFQSQLQLQFASPSTHSIQRICIHLYLVILPSPPNQDPKMKRKKKKNMVANLGKRRLNRRPIIYIIYLFMNMDGGSYNLNPRGKRRDSWFLILLLL